jgi:hypothetical protein
MLRAIPHLSRTVVTFVRKLKDFEFSKLTHKLQSQFHSVSDLDGF